MDCAGIFRPRRLGDRHLARSDTRRRDDQRHDLVLARVGIDTHLYDDLAAASDRDGAAAWIDVDGFTGLDDVAVEGDEVTGPEPLVDLDGDPGNHPFDFVELVAHPVGQLGLRILEPEAVGASGGEELSRLPLRAGQVGEDRRARHEGVGALEVLACSLPILCARGLQPCTELASGFRFGLVLRRGGTHLAEEGRPEGQLKDEPSHRWRAYPNRPEPGPPIRAVADRRAQPLLSGRDESR